MSYISNGYIITKGTSQKSKVKTRPKNRFKGLNKLLKCLDNNCRNTSSCLMQ
ncbi:hypothetical protein Hanom_Chr08g00730101 [Helianthus anomalus]